MTEELRIGLLDVVQLMEDLPSEALLTGALGTVVDVHVTPCLAYEVEFCDDQGRTIALAALLPSQVRLVWRRS